MLLFNLILFGNLELETSSFKLQVSGLGPHDYFIVVSMWGHGHNLGLKKGGSEKFASCLEPNVRVAPSVGLGCAARDSAP